MLKQLVPLLTDIGEDQIIEGSEIVGELKGTVHPSKSCPDEWRRTKDFPPFPLVFGNPL